MAADTCHVHREALLFTLSRACSKMADLPLGTIHGVNQRGRPFATPLRRTKHQNSEAFVADIGLKLGGGSYTRAQKRFNTS